MLAGTINRRGISSRWMKNSRLVLAEGLESRLLLSSSTLAAVNLAPTVAQAIVINNNTAITGRTANLSVLGNDDHGESNLAYSWSVTSAPAGSAVSFSTNATNAAKSSIATFNMAGIYTLSAKITDASGLSVSTSRSVQVNATVTTLRILANNQVVSSTAGLTTAATGVFFNVQGTDQFGTVMTVSSGLNWSFSTLPANTSSPSIWSASNAASITFAKVGTYGVTVQYGTSAVACSVPITVNPTICAIRNNSTTPVVVTGTSIVLNVPTFIDQFGNAMPTPAITWSLYCKPQAAPAPTFSTVNGATTATFGLAGSYYINACVTGLPYMTFVDVITVNQTASSLVVTPGTATVSKGADLQFTAKALDQFQQPMVGAQPTISWSATGGTITAAGLFTAGTTGTSATVTARYGIATGSASLTLQAAGSLQNAFLASLVKTLDADGSISRADMIQILRSVSSYGAITASEFSDLKTLLNQASTLNILGYVGVLAGDIINGNAANATYLGKALGNLTVGSSATQLNNLIDKWFFGGDLPTLCNTSLTYKSVAGSLFPHTPTHLDEYQGSLGDCYLISALGTLADSNPAAIQNMIIDNGDNTYTVRFYSGTYGTIYNYSDGSISAGFTNNVGTPDYITVNRYLPATSSGMLAYADYGASATNTANALWIPLIEKAYAQWNQTGKEGRDGTNAYASIQGGWMATVDAQVLGHNAIDYIMTSTSQQVAINALAAHKAVTIGTLSFSGTNLGLYPSHAYAITAYNASTNTFTLYNPWGSNQPGQLTWSQLQATCTQMAVCDTTGSLPISGTVIRSSSTSMFGSPLADTLPSASGALVGPVAVSHGANAWDLSSGVVPPMPGSSSAPGTPTLIFVTTPAAEVSHVSLSQMLEGEFSQWPAMLAVGL